MDKRSKFEKAKEFNKEPQNKNIRSQSQNPKYAINNLNKDKLSINKNYNNIVKNNFLGNTNSYKKNDFIPKYEISSNDFYKKNSDYTVSKKNEAYSYLPNIPNKKQNSEINKDKALFDNNSSNINSNNTFLSNNKLNNQNNSKNNVLNSPSFTNIYFTDKAKTDTKILLKSHFSDIGNEIPKTSSLNNFTNIQNSNIGFSSKINLDTTKESPKTIIYDSTPNPKNISYSLNDTIDKQNSKLLDSPPKKFLDPSINQSINNNNSVKIFNNNSSSSSSFNSQSPIEKVHLTSVGLSNLGNTCFMNTSLQILIHSSKFIPDFIQRFKQMNINEGTITYEFYNLLKEISTSNYSISPSSFKDTFGRKHRKFNNYAQHDSQEFLRHLLEDISSEMNLSRSKVFRELDTKEKSLIVLNEEYHKLFLERENSIILDIFYGQFCNTFECNKCNYKTYSFEKFIDIPILLDSNEYNTDLSSLLKKHFQAEEFDWDSPCENTNCKRKCPHKKIMKISKAPNILTVSIQRYNFRSKSKNTARISFSEKFDLSDFCEMECLKDEILSYKLYGISNHSGSLDFGHYYAYCNVNNEWKEFNDSSVSKCYNFSLSSQTVYVLFYEKMKPK